MTIRIFVRTVLALALMATTSSACGNGGLLEVNDPDVITPGDVTGQMGAELLWAGALGQFARAFSSGTGGQVVYTGLVTDEFHSSDTDPGLHQIDRRELDDRNANLLIQYRLLHQARVGLSNAAERLEQELPGDSRIAEMWSLNGYAHLLFAEDYCSGVPLSHTPIEGEVVYGPRVPTAALLDTAVARFQAATGAAASDVDQVNLAAVGLARTYLDRGDYAQAAAAVASVPDDWEYLMRSKSDLLLEQVNAVYFNNQARGGWSLSDGEGGNGVMFRTDGDVRVPWQDSGGFGIDEATPLFFQQKYNSGDAPVALASGVEARLIEAEADLNGSATAWLTILNDLRATVGLGALSDPGSRDERVDLLFDERARWLFGTAHRLGDLRRLVRQYGRDQATVFPSGVYFRGGTFGSDVNFPVPIEELQNPALSDVTGAVCLNRDA